MPIVASSRRADVCSAAVLGGAYGVLAAIAAMAILPVVRAHTEVTLPMPEWAFAVILAMQMAVLYGLLAFGGLRMARARGLNPMPALWSRRDGVRERMVGLAVAAGVACGAGLVLGVMAIQRVFPGTLPPTLHPPGLGAALAASSAAAVGEEILCRLFLLSLVLRVMPPGAAHARSVASIVSALAFGVLHLPGMVMIFGGLSSVPALAWVWVVGLNAAVGAVFGWLFLRRGTVAAIAAHWFCDLVWHVGSLL